MRKNGYRLFGLINPVDILLAAALAALVYFALQFAAPQEVSARAGDSLIRYTIELKGKREGFHERIEIGTALYDNVRDFLIGTIVDVKPLPYYEEAFDIEACIIREAPVAGLENIYILVEASAQINDGSTSIGQYEIAVGRDVFVRNNRIAGKGFVTSIVKIGE